MKKGFFSVAFATLALAGAYLGYYSYQQQKADKILLANIEALTDDGESYPETGTRYKCYSSTHYKENSYVVICTTCDLLKNQTDDVFCFHDWCYR